MQPKHFLGSIDLNALRISINITHLSIGWRLRPKLNAWQSLLLPNFLCTIWLSASIFHIQFAPEQNILHASSTKFGSYSVLYSITYIAPKFLTFGLSLSSSTWSCISRTGKLSHLRKPIESHFIWIIFRGFFIWGNYGTRIQKKARLAISLHYILAHTFISTICVLSFREQFSMSILASYS